jgi:ABC-type transport system involved in multi-copper enzyme maturation permease subunit
MRRALVIVQKDLAEVFKSRSTYLYMFVMLFPSASYFFSYFAVADSLTKQHVSAEVVMAVSRNFMATVAYIVPILYGLFASQISINLVVLEKTKRNLESLMAAPFTVREIWLAKSVGVSASSVVIGWAASVFAYLLIAFGEVAPHVHAFIAPPPLAIVSGLVVVPLLVLAVISLVTYMQLVISNPRVSNFVFVAVFLVVLGVLLFSLYGLPGRALDQRYYLPLFAGVAAVVGLVSLGFSRRLTKEKIITSNKQ